MLTEPLILMAAVCLFFMTFVGFTSKRHFLIYILVLGMLLGPRIPLGQVAAMQRLDFRIDDFMIMLLFPIGIIFTLIYRPRYPRYMYILLAFIAFSLLTTIYASLTGDDVGIRQVVFFGKEAEYMALAFIIPVFILNDEQIKGVFKVVAFGIALNIVWLFAQAAIGEKGPLISLVDVPSYGFTMIAEAQPFQVGAIFSYALLLFAATFFIYKRSVWMLLLAFGSLLGVIATLSRTFIFSSVASFFLLTILLFMTRKKLSALNFIILTSVYAAATAIFVTIFPILDEMGLPVFRMGSDAVDKSLSGSREQDIWIPLWSSFLDNPIIGYGKGSINNLLGTIDEAHNYFLRLLLETGVIGASMFVLFLVLMTISAYRLYSKAELSPERRLVMLFTLLVTASICTAAMVQDAFYSSKVALTFYLMVGLLARIDMDERKARLERVAAADELIPD